MMVPAAAHAARESNAGSAGSFVPSSSVATSNVSIGRFSPVVGIVSGRFVTSVHGFQTPLPSRAAAASNGMKRFTPP